MNNNITHSLCEQEDKGQKRSRSDEDERQQTKPPALRETSTSQAESPTVAGESFAQQQPQLSGQPQNVFLQNLQGLMQVQQQSQHQPAAGINTFSTVNQQNNSLSSNPLLSYLASGNGGNPQGLNLAALGLQQQNYPGGIHTLLGFGMPLAGNPAPGLNLQGMDANLLRTLLLAQTRGQVQQQPAAAAQGQGNPQQQGNQRPDPPAEGSTAGPNPAVSASAVAIAPPNNTSALPLLHSFVSAGQLNPVLGLGNPVPPAASAPNGRPRPHQSHLVDNSGTRRLLLYVPSDDDSISPYQAFARQNIELFEAKEVDVQTGAQGRNKPVQLGQVGIRCIHCADLHPKLRSRASVYYPSRLTVLYQAAQNIVNVHLPELCESIPPNVRKKLIGLDNKRSSVGGGKNYWSDTAQIQGIIDTGNGLRFSDERKKNRLG